MIIAPHYITPRRTQSFYYSTPATHSAEAGDPQEPGQPQRRLTTPELDYGLSSRLTERYFHSRKPGPCDLKRASLRVPARAFYTSLLSTSQTAVDSQGNRVFQGWSFLLLSFAPCQAWRPLSSMNSMPLVVGKHNPPDIPAGLPRSSDYARPAASPE